ncbi:hypothetical protein HY025_01360 [Candidatus Daviesbacteria bacterium]|nr:hypothetical protein [Candidatus Daviesbacteria bacterium]
MMLEFKDRSNGTSHGSETPLPLSYDQSLQKLIDFLSPEAPVILVTCQQIVWQLPSFVRRGQEVGRLEAARGFPGLGAHLINCDHHMFDYRRLLEKPVEASLTPTNLASLN